MNASLRRADRSPGSPERRNRDGIASSAYRSRAASRSSTRGFQSTSRGAPRRPSSAAPRASRASNGQ
ncbi:hypothetical protein WS71_07950 [Burkholderia mayonis]|uniref:Uncharacterized protein n=1 Tax=Burkholderia mayonis TaxID=1385591 RepID=A0A1B4FU98_9BURK|nr:hypothetical protein WS71_07950 [Burkholderia mayonis]KVE47693.1 hypothetical protein WS71_19230 [Burkholderia mayonis]